MKIISNIFEEGGMATYVASSYVLEVETGSGKKMNLEIWDTAGKQRFREVNKIFYKNARAVLSVYDITNRSSFEEITDYRADQVKENACLNVVLGVIGNKSDLFEEEQVKEEEAKEFAESIGAFFMLTSTKLGTGISEAFKEIAEMIEKTGPIQLRNNNYYDEKSTLKIGKEQRTIDYNKCA